MQISDYKVLDLQVLECFHFRLLAGALTQSDSVPKIKQEFDCMFVFLFESFDFVWQTSFEGIGNREQAIGVSTSEAINRPLEEVQKYFIFHFLEHAFAI